MLQAWLVDKYKTIFVTESVTQVYRILSCMKTGCCMPEQIKCWVLHWSLHVKSYWIHKTQRRVYNWTA